MFEHPYFRKTGTFRFDGVVPASPATPFHKSEAKEKARMVKYQCGACKYSFSRKDDYKGDLFRCPYCGRDGTVQLTKSAEQLLTELID